MLSQVDFSRAVFDKPMPAFSDVSCRELHDLVSSQTRGENR